MDEPSVRQLVALPEFADKNGSVGQARENICVFDLDVEAAGVSKLEAAMSVPLALFKADICVALILEVDEKERDSWVQLHSKLTGTP
ncbi:MAG: hypothetical protein WDO12_03305 [Pseudomonadota bacterium]